jgi:hypothetical protein
MPEALRAKVLSAVISVNTLDAPLGFLAAGQVLEHWGVVPLFTVVVAGMTWLAIVLATIVLRYRDADAAVARGDVGRSGRAAAAGAGRSARRRPLPPRAYVRQVA